MVPRPLESSAGEPLPLNPSRAELERLLEKVGDCVHRFIDTLPDQPASANQRAAEARSWVEEPPPERGVPLESALERLFADIIPCGFNTASPGYLAYVPGGGLYTAALADFIAGAVNRYVGVWEAAPGAAELESQALRWLARLLDMPSTTLGLLTTGGSFSNLVAVVAAREQKLGGELQRGTVYMSTETHYSMPKAARIAGVRPENIREIPIDDRFRIRTDRLAQRIVEDRANGLIPFLICANAGTVNTGAVDPLDELADLAAREELWLHADGAYGAVFKITDSGREALSGLERADSIALDPHKGLFIAYGLGALLVREPATLRRAFSDSASYLPTFQADELRPDFCALSPELSRSWRGLKLWLPLKLHGVAAFREALEERLALARFLYDALVEEPKIEIAVPPELSLFAFRQRVPGATVDEANAVNRQVLARINAHGRVFLTGTELNGCFFIRACVLHLRTDRARVEEALELIRGALR